MALNTDDHLNYIMAQNFFEPHRQHGACQISRLIWKLFIDKQTVFIVRTVQST